MNARRRPDPQENPSAGRRLRLRIRRQDAPLRPPRWEVFHVPVGPGANVISCLQSIAANPVTAEGTPTTPVAYDAGCLEEVCGACTMVINGRVRQACSCLVEQAAPREGDRITLEPMSKFPVVRDLMVDRTRLFEALRRLKAWIPIDGTYHLGPGPRSTPAQQQMRYRISECMSCGCCLEACPQYGLEADESRWEQSFIGAHAIAQARLFNEHPTGSVLRDERLEVLAGRGGVSDCGNAQNCVKVCPKSIPLTEAIAAAGRAVTGYSLRRFWGQSP